MKLTRSAGILLHPTSLPAPHGVGNIGQASRACIDFLARAGQTYWQMLPLGPITYGDSPYQALSAFAGCPLLVDLEDLVEAGWLDRSDLEGAPDHAHAVRYSEVIPFHDRMLALAWERFQARSEASAREAMDVFAASQEEWLGDFALFMALKLSLGGAAWTSWPEELRRRDPGALARARADLADGIAYQVFVQWIFHEQMQSLRAHASERGIRLIGDLPIFVSMDSADAWAHPELFHFDEKGHATVVAGVPPDYFSETGQLWGNPLYRWEVSRATGHAWWIARMRQALAQFDLVRIDHFRGFEAYWEIPAGALNAIGGRWVPGPGIDLFEALGRELGDLPVIAEDLGLITPEVEALRDGAGLPGMKILQFAFGGDDDNAYLPHRHVEHGVVYTGTHDNDTTVGWWQSAEAPVRDHACRVLGVGPEQVPGALIEAALGSRANLAVIPMQDWLGLGAEARMNTPGLPEGNWAWRVAPGALVEGLAEHIAVRTRAHGR